MTVKDIMNTLNLRLIAGEGGIDKEVNGVYACDLLSWVMAHAAKGNAWVTIQTHPNVIAVATLLELSCIIIPENAEIEEAAINKADEEAIPLFISQDSGYKVCCSLFSLLEGK